MESNEILDNQYQDSLIITEASRGYLAETAKWGNFLSIMGFIAVGLMIIAGIFMSISMTMVGDMDGFNEMGVPPVLFGLFYIALAAIYFFPVLYLYRFSKEAKQALAKESTESLTTALENLKSMFKFYGIFTVVFLVLYGIGIVVMMIFGVSAAF